MKITIQANYEKYDGISDLVETELTVIEREDSVVIEFPEMPTLVNRVIVDRNELKRLLTVLLS